MLLEWVLCDQREAEKTDEKSEICQTVRDEPQELLLSKNMPFLKGKQSLEGVRSPRGEESKTARTHWGGQWNNREAHITHPLPVRLARLQEDERQSRD